MEIWNILASWDLIFCGLYPRLTTSGQSDVGHAQKQKKSEQNCCSVYGVAGCHQWNIAGFLLAAIVSTAIQAARPVVIPCRMAHKGDSGENDRPTREIYEQAVHRLRSADRSKCTRRGRRHTTWGDESTIQRVCRSQPGGSGVSGIHYIKCVFLFPCSIVLF